LSNYQDIAKNIRNRLRQYNLNSIVDACLTILYHFRGQGLEELRSAPWLTLLIVKLALEDACINIQDGKDCPIEEIDRARNAIWNATEKNSNAVPSGVFLMIRSLIHPQILFQQPESFSFIRWPALIAELPVDHPTRLQFIETLGCDPDTFIVVIFAIYVAVLDGKKFISLRFFDPLRPRYGEAIESILNRYAKDFVFLRSELRKELKNRLYEEVNGKIKIKKDAIPRPDSEKIEFPWLSKFPLLKHQSGEIAVWHPLVFARSMEDGVHNALAPLGQAYTDPFSKVFEKYVLTLTSETGLSYYTEDDMRGRIRSRPAVEALISGRECNILIESKMSLFADNVLISDSTHQVFVKLKRIREAIVQGWKVGEQIRNGEVSIGTTSTPLIDYLIVVTSRQLNIGSGEHLKRLFGDDVFNRINPEVGFVPSASQLTRLPPKNIFFLGIEEYERLTGAIASGEVDIENLLQQAAKESEDPKTSSLHFSQILQPHVKKWKSSKLIQDARTRAENQLEQCLVSSEIA